MAVHVLLLLYGVALVKWTSGQELFKDPGFEVPHAPDWATNGFGFSMQTVTSDKHGGNSALLVTGRNNFWEGPAQKPSIHPGGRYLFSSYVKILNNKPGVLFQRITLTGAFTWRDSGKTDYFDFALNHMIRSQDGWTLLKSDIKAPVRPWTSASLYLQGPDPGVDFMVDDMSLTEVPEDNSWRSKAKASVEALRKSNIAFKINAAHNFDPHQVQIEIQHKRHLFAWGSVIDADHIVNPDYREYQNIFYDFFNWGTVGSFKWRFNQGTPDHPDYTQAVKAMNELRRNGVKVRGHNMFWGVPLNVPDWVKKLDAAQLRAAIDTRIKFMTGITLGKLDHWDVNNELLHGQYFEETTGDPRYSLHIYDAVHRADPKVQLFLNDFDVVALGGSTEQFVAQANAFKAANVGLYGLGLQSHFHPDLPPDPTLLKRRLDRLATTGLPLWVTELTLEDSNDQRRADVMEDVLLTYFAHPSVEGVVFWGFWDQGGNPHSMLVDGENYKLNAVGRRYLDLIKSQWSTHVVRHLSDGDQFTVRGFQGDYDVLVRYQGKPIKLQQFHLGKGNANVAITLTPHDHEIAVPTTLDPFTSMQHPGHVSHVGAHTLGVASSSTSQGTLTCETRWSAYSAVGDDKKASVACADDEVLTGCSSYLKNHEHERDGEMLQNEGGKMHCVAVNGGQSSGPTQAIGRCCKVKGLQCTYKSAGPSGTGINDRVETDCTAGQFPTGCLSYAWVSEMDGAYPVNHSCMAQNDGVLFGVYSYAACCGAPGMTCVTKYSAPSGLRVGAQATVFCDAGYVMTGCSVFSQYGGTAGAYIGSDGPQGPCLAFNGEEKYGSEEGVKAVATCCKVN